MSVVALQGHRWVGVCGGCLLGLKVLATFDEGLGTTAEGELLAEGLDLIGSVLPGVEVAEVLSHAPGCALGSDLGAVPLQ